MVISSFLSFLFLYHLTIFFLEIEGIIKTELREYQSQDIKYTVGSITDCNYKIELKANFDCSELKIKKGMSVEVIGYMEQFPPAQPYLRIGKKKDIIKVERERIPFVDVLKGFRIPT